VARTDGVRARGDEHEPMTSHPPPHVLDAVGTAPRPPDVPVALDVDRRLAVLRDAADRARFALRRAEDDAEAEVRALERDGDSFAGREAETRGLLAERGYLSHPAGQ